MKRLITLLVAATLVSCSAMTMNVKPLPKDAIPCGSDWECPETMHCGFAHVDEYAQCLPGGGDWRWSASNEVRP